jgi:hypothetical protein
MTIMYGDVAMISTQGMYNNKKSNFAGEDIYYGPNNKKEDPCGACPLAGNCVVECKAFTMWIDKGNYAADMVAQFKKNPKSVKTDCFG